MKILSNEMAQHYQISSLNRGHLIFTSLICKRGKIFFLDAHIERLLKGAQFLFPNREWSLNHQKLKQHIVDMFKNESADFYLRVTLFDEVIHIEKRSIDHSSDNLKLTKAFKMKTPDLIPSYLKVSNYLVSDLELAKAKERGFDDVLYFDNNAHVTEASTSNVFIVTESGEIKTPKASSMVLEGIIRQNLLIKLKEMGFDFLEADISKAELEKAQEIWLTNSVKGIRFVSQFESQIFNRSGSTYDKVIAHFGRYGELI